MEYFLPYLIGMLFAEKNLLPKIANYKIIKRNVYMNKTLKFTIGIVLLICSYFIYLKTNIWELKVGIIPIFVICFLYEFILEIPIIKQILEFLGKHATNIFLIHDFIRTTYFTAFTYSFTNFIKIGVVLLLISLAISIVLELFKKVIKYNKIIERLQLFINTKIDGSYNEKQENY